MPEVLRGAPEYRIREQLATGGMGVVHLGLMVTPAGERQVAIKRLLGQSEADVEARSRIVAEARLVFQLTHANIGQVLDVASSGDATFIVMEYVDGCDLASLIAARARAHQPLPVPVAVHIAREVGKALAYAHRRTTPDGRAMFLVHGDIKPSNVLLSREGEVKLVDFGIARALGTHAPGNRIQGGTPGFIAPEAKVGRIDQRSDLYALGVTLKLALGGVLARSQSTDADPGNPRSLDPELLAILERATATRPEDRFATARDLEHALTLYLGHNFPSFNPSVLASLVADNMGQRVRHLGQEETLLSLTHPGMTPHPSVLHSVVDARIAGGTRQAARRRPIGRRARWGAAATAAGALVAAAWWRTQSLRASPEVATSSLAPAVSAVPERPTEPAKDPPPIVSTPSAAPAVRPPVGAKARKPSPKPLGSAELASRRPTTEPGYLTVNADPWGVVLVDGRRMAEQTPAYRLPVAAGAHVVTVMDPETRRTARPRTVEVKSTVVSVVGFKW